MPGPPVSSWVGALVEGAAGTTTPGAASARSAAARIGSRQ
jgi:hypothetical protein